MQEETAKVQTTSTLTRTTGLSLAPTNHHPTAHISVRTFVTIPHIFCVPSTMSRNTQQNYKKKL
jgi:hypothetical protein